MENSGGSNLPNTAIVRNIMPSARIYGVELTDLLILMAGMPACLVVACVLPQVAIPIDIAGWLGGRRMPNPPNIPLVPLVPGAFLWGLSALSYMIFRGFKPVSYVKDFWQELNDAVDRFNGINPNIWELGPDFDIDQYVLKSGQNAPKQKR